MNLDELDRLHQAKGVVQEDEIFDDDSDTEQDLTDALSLLERVAHVFKLMDGAELFVKMSRPTWIKFCRVDREVRDFLLEWDFADPDDIIEGEKAGDK